MIRLLWPLPPLGELGQALVQVVVGEQGAVVEEWLRPLGHGIGGEQLVILGVGVQLGVGEAAKHPKLDLGGIPAVDREDARADGDLACRHRRRRSAGQGALQ